MTIFKLISHEIESMKEKNKCILERKALTITYLKLLLTQKNYSIQILKQ